MAKTLSGLQSFILTPINLLTKAMQALEKRGQPGLYRVVQMQRCLWAEMEAGQLRLHGSHSSCPESLAQIVKIYEREAGRRPVEKARHHRAQAKPSRANEQRPNPNLIYFRSH